MLSEPWIDAVAAAQHVGYGPTQIRLFYKWLRRHRVEKHYRGRALVFRRSALDAAIARLTEAQEDAQDRDRFGHMATLARRHARG